MQFEKMINTIILGNSYELIKDIPTNSIDCIYIDIPYLFETGGVSDTALSKRIQKQMNNTLKDIRKGIDYRIFDELKRIMKFINIFIWCSKEQILDILNYWSKENISYEILVWTKTNPTPQTNGVWLPDIEYCLFFREKGNKLNDGYDLKSKWYSSPINKKDKEKYKHPTIKPLELVKRHILHATQKGDVILDCFSGSGTTCVAAKELDRISVDRGNGILTNRQISFDTDTSKL